MNIKKQIKSTNLSFDTQPTNLINKERIVGTFIKYAKIDSGSDDNLAEAQIPSTEEQKHIAQVLKSELEEIRLFNVHMSENYIVYGTLPTNLDDNNKKIGLLAHYDTSSQVQNKNVKPIIHQYTSGDIKLSDNTIINQKDLKPYQNQEIITSDGTTLLGADDKAGIAEIIEVLRVLSENKNIKHPEIKIAFTPDEETGMGIEKFNIKDFGADLAYTIDGDMPDTIENETFNAFNPEIIIKGKPVHCGYAKGKMISANDVAIWILSKIPENKKAQNTEGKDGYIHINSISSNVSEAKINLLVRDHDYKKSQEKIKFLESVIKKAEKKFKCEINFDEKEKYHNMKQYLDEYPEVMDNALEGIERTGFEPKVKSIRGGTDGSYLSEHGLPTPNLPAGGLNFHSKSEFIPVSNLIDCAKNILNILSVWTEKK